MRRPAIVTSSTIAAVCLASLAHANDYHASPSGSGTACTEASPCTLSSAMSKVTGGDTIFLHKGNYGGLTVSKSGSENAWITIAAYPGDVPYFSGIGVNGNYVRFDGLVSRNSQYTGFGNPYSDSCAAHTAGNIQYIHCIADGNGINGIAHYCAPGVLVQQSIVAHNGAGQNSWSSGVNLYGVTGGTASNIVRETIAFDSWDSSSNHSDGSGFIVDVHSEGATFINNVGFENGGSCIRLTNSSNTLIVNNTCYGNAKDPDAKYNDEIMYSDATSRTGAVLTNNISIPTTAGKNGIGNASGVSQSNNVTSGSASIFVSVPGAANVNFNLTVSATTAIDKGTTANAPANDIGFDPKCITKATPTNVYVYSGYAMPSWWTYSIDYAYIEQIGGVAKCWQTRSRSATPDIGAFEYNATSVTGGAPSTGGATSTGGTTGTMASTATGGVNVSGGTDAGGAPLTGGSRASGGTVAAGGTSALGGSGGAGGVVAVGGAPVTGGSRATGGAVAVGGAPVTGGSRATGGAVVAGGAPVTGGSRATGGVVAAGGTPVIGSGAVTGGTPSVASSGTGGTAYGAGGGQNATSDTSSTGVGGNSGSSNVGARGAGKAGSSTGQVNPSVNANNSSSEEPGNCSCYVTATRSNSPSFIGLGLLGILLLRGGRPKNGANRCRRSNP